MTRMLAVLVVACACALACAAAQERDQKPIDFGYANKLYQKQKSGQTLTEDERAYLERVKTEIKQRKAEAGRNPQRSSNAPSGGTKARVNMQRLTVTPRDKTGLVPLDQMTAKDIYKGQDGGLYGAGKNDPPLEQLKAAQKALAQVQKLDEGGKPSPEGKIVLMSIGMSNTMNEFGRFKRDVEGSQDRSPAVVLVNGALGGQTAAAWTTSDSGVWEGVQQRLKAANVTARQVQVIWLKQVIGGPFRFGDFPKHAQQLKEFLIEGINQLMQHYPNVRVIYLSSRIYGGYANIDLNCEPYAYESAYSVRWVIQDQIEGDPRLNYDPARGEVKSPVLLWGPYLWADGTTPRQSDGLTYEADEFADDGTHPSHSAQEKVSKLLQRFFKSELNAAWYVKGGGAAQALEAPAGFRRGG